MTTENIIKLLLAPSIEDVILGLNFLKDHTVATIRTDFKHVLDEENSSGNWFGAKIKTKTLHKNIPRSYLKINGNLICCIEGYTLIFRDPNIRYNTGYRIIDL